MIVATAFFRAGRRLAAGMPALAALLVPSLVPSTVPSILPLLVPLVVPATARAAAPACAWPEWAAFRRGTMSADGRVIDASEPQLITTSEGQSYALFFALVANDRATFDKVFAWTETNLAQGDLATHLPAWLWGRLDGGGASGVSAASAASAASTSTAGENAPRWGVLDTNSASDADLWIAYTLLEAGRLWNERRYTAVGTVMARNIAQRESASLPGLGRTLLPGAVGFHVDTDGWRLNPSYVPLQVMRRLALALPEQGEWQAMLETSAKLVHDTAPKGYSPDWAVWRRKTGFGPDDQTKAESAYNAIRVYLWAGMLAPDDPLRANTLAAFRPLADFVEAHGFPPERVDTQTGMPGPNAGNAGFSAAVAPYLAALGRADLASAQAARSRSLALESPPGYYSQVLMLFGLGYLDGLMRFDAQGRVVPAWTATCPATR